METRSARGFLEPVAATSAAFEESVLAPLRDHFLFPESQQRFTYSSAWLINNNALQKQYAAFRDEKLKEGYSEKELEESFGFLLFDEENEAKKICKDGLSVGKVKCASLGDPYKGVYISKYSDCLDLPPWFRGQTGHVVIFKLTQGRVKAVKENHTELFPAPTPGFDCHVSERLGSVSASASSEQTQQCFLYELRDGRRVARFPRHACPVAVAAFSYRMEKTTSDLKTKREQSASPYQLWEGQFKIDSSVYDVGLQSARGACFPAKLPKTVQIDHAIGVSELKRALPREIFETCIVGEVCIDGRCFNVYDVVSSKAKNDLEMVALDLQQKDMALVIPLEDSGFLILLHSSHLFSHEDTRKAAALQGMFIFPDTRSVSRGVPAIGVWCNSTLASSSDSAFSIAANASTCNTNAYCDAPSTVSTDILQAIPALHYAEAEMQTSGQEASSAALEKHLQDYGALVQSGEARASPDQYDVPGGFTLIAPKWTQESGKRLKSYFDEPCGFAVPVVRALELLSAGQRRGQDKVVFTTEDVTPSEEPEELSSEGKAREPVHKHPHILQDLESLRTVAKKAGSLPGLGSTESDKADVEEMSHNLVHSCSRQPIRSAEESAKALSEEKERPSGAADQELHGVNMIPVSRRRGRKRKMHWKTLQVLMKGTKETSCLDLPVNHKEGVEKDPNLKEREPADLMRPGSAPPRKRRGSNPVQTESRPEQTSKTSSETHLGIGTSASEDHPKLSSEVKTVPVKRKMTETKRQYGPKSIITTCGRVFVPHGSEVGTRNVTNTEKMSFNSRVDQTADIGSPVLSSMANPSDEWMSQAASLKTQPVDGPTSSRPDSSTPEKRKKRGKHDVYCATTISHLKTVLRRGKPETASHHGSQFQKRDIMEGTKDNKYEAHPTFLESLELQKRPAFLRDLIQKSGTGKGSLESEMVKQADQQLLSLMDGVRRRFATDGKASADRRTTSASLPSDALSLLADLALGASKAKLLTSEVTSGQDFDDGRSSGSPESVLHALLRCPAIGLKLPPRSPFPEALLVTGELVLEISKEHSYSQPTSVEQSGHFTQASPSNPKSAIHLSSQAYVSSDGHGSKAPKLKGRKAKIFPNRCITEKNGDVRVVRTWKEDYDFKYDSKFTDVEKDKVVIRALHGNWDFTIRDSFEDVHLIFHMWIGLFYTKPSSRFINLENCAALEKKVRDGDQKDTNASKINELSLNRISTATGASAEVLDLSVKPSEAVSLRSGASLRDGPSLPLRDTGPPDRRPSNSPEVTALMKYRSSVGVAKETPGPESDEDVDDESDVTDCSYSLHLERNRAYNRLCENASKLTIGVPYVLPKMPIEEKHPSPTPETIIFHCRMARQNSRLLQPSAFSQSWGLQQKIVSEESKPHVMSDTRTQQNVDSEAEDASKSFVSQPNDDAPADEEILPMCLKDPKGEKSEEPVTSSDRHTPTTRNEQLDSEVGVRSHFSVVNSQPHSNLSRNKPTSPPLQRIPTVNSVCSSPKLDGVPLDLVFDEASQEAKYSPELSPECKSSQHVEEVLNLAVWTKREYSKANEYLLNEKPPQMRSESSSSSKYYKGGEASPTDSEALFKNHQRDDANEFYFKCSASEDYKRDRSHSSGEGEGPTCSRYLAEHRSYRHKNYKERKRFGVTKRHLEGVTCRDLELLEKRRKNHEIERLNEDSFHHVDLRKNKTFDWGRYFRRREAPSDESANLPLLDSRVTFNHHSLDAPSSSHQDHLWRAKEKEKDPTQSLVEVEYHRFSEKLQQIFKGTGSNSPPGKPPRSTTSSRSPCSHSGSSTELQRAQSSYTNTRFQAVVSERSQRLLRCHRPRHLKKVLVDREGCSYKSKETASPNEKTQKHQDQERLPGRLNTESSDVFHPAVRNKYRFYVLVTSEDPFFEETKSVLEFEGFVPVEPEEFDLSGDRQSPLIVIVRNEDFEEHICEVPYLLELKESPHVTFAGIDRPDDVVNFTHQEFFTSGGFVVCDEQAFESLTLDNMRSVVDVLEHLDGKGNWKWFLHYRDSRKLREKARLSGEALRKQRFVDFCRDAGTIDVLPYHPCDVVSRDQPDYLSCLSGLQIQYASVRLTLFVTDAPAPTFGTHGILAVNIQTFLQMFSKDTCTV